MEATNVSKLTLVDLSQFCSARISKRKLTALFVLSNAIIFVTYMLGYIPSMIFGTRIEDVQIELPDINFDEMLPVAMRKGKIWSKRELTYIICFLFFQSFFLPTVASVTNFLRLGTFEVSNSINLTQI